MLETLLALKNNDVRKIPGYDPEPVERLRKLQRGLVSGRCLPWEHAFLPGGLLPIPGEPAPPPWGAVLPPWGAVASLGGRLLPGGPSLCLSSLGCTLL